MSRLLPARARARNFPPFAAESALVGQSSAASVDAGEASIRKTRKNRQLTGCFHTSHWTMTSAINPRSRRALSYIDVYQINFNVKNI